MSQSAKDGASRKDRPATRGALFQDGFPASVRDALDETEQVLAHDYRDGVERRIDAPHPLGATPPRGEDSTPAPAQREPMRRAEMREAAPASPAFDDDLFSQANQIASRLRSQLGEIDRRESQLNEQLSSLDSERRSIRNWVGQFEEDMVQRAGRIRAREGELVQNNAAAEELVQELRDMERGAQDMRDEILGEKAQLRSQVEQEFASQRAEIAQGRQALDESRKLLAEQTEQNRREHEAAILESRRRLEEEWTRLNEQAEVTARQADAEIDSRRRQLEAEFLQKSQELESRLGSRLLELADEKAVVRAHVERDLSDQRSEVELAKQTIEEQRRTLSEQIERNQREHAQAMQETQRRLDEEWARLTKQAATQLEKERTRLELDRAAWTAQRDAEQQRLQRERELQESNQRRAEEDLDARRKHFESDLQAQTQEHEQRVAEELKKLSDERERTRAQQQQERAVFENRLRFQKEHIEKAREELETSRSEFRREQQQVRSLNERSDSLLRKHRAQLERFRELLEEREKSMDREVDLLNRSRRNFENEAEGQRGKIKMEWESFSQERQSQRAELRRQRDQLGVLAENLESRRMRLDHLRNELEETHRATLEMRLAVEEAWARMTHAAGSDAARRQVEDARKAYGEHFRHLHEQIASRRVELGDVARSIQKQRDDFTVERQTLASWMSERDESLRLREEQLRRDVDYLQVRETAWRAARDRWNSEKLSAEEIIRDLLRQLTQLNDIDRSAVDREHFPLNPLMMKAEAPAA